MDHEVKKLLAEPTVDGLVAGRLLGLGRNSTYAALRSGQIPACRIGRLYRVPSAKLREMLGLPAASIAA